MKNIFRKSIFACLNICMFASILASCSDFTDITQKGKNLLASTDDIDLLFNKEFDMWNNDMRTISGVLYAYSSVSAQLAQENKSRNAILFGYMDNADMLTRLEILTTSDTYYSDFYANIGKVANPALSQLKALDQEDNKVKALQAEALTLRAYSHYMLVQKYAVPYTSANKDEKAIILLTEDDDIQEYQEMSTLEEVYTQCLEDINKAISLNAMPVTASSKGRMNQAAMYGVKAMICLSYQKYSDAIEAAQKAISLNGNLYKYWENVETGYSYGGDPYFYCTVSCKDDPETNFAMPTYVYYSWVNPNLVAKMEPSYARYFLFPKMGDMYKGISKIMPAYAIYEDYGAMLGLSGWDSGYDFTNYNNDSGLYTGEMYLILAEAQIKNGDLAGAAASLNTLRESRVDQNNYQPYSFTSKEQAILAYQSDYLAENVWTWWNFIGMKRWNADVEWSVGPLSQTIGGTTYTLEPGSQLWVFPFPTSVTGKNGNVTWNKVK